MGVEYIYVIQTQLGFRHHTLTNGITGKFDKWSECCNTKIVQSRIGILSAWCQQRV